MAGGMDNDGRIPHIDSLKTLKFATMRTETTILELNFRTTGNRMPETQIILLELCQMLNP